MLITTAAPTAASPSSLPVDPAPANVAAPSTVASNSTRHWGPWLGLAAVTLTTASAFNDRWLTQESTEGSSANEGRLARFFEPAGNTGVVAPALLLTYGAARLTGHLEFADATRRVGLSVLGAGLLSLALKEATGRARPDESPRDSQRFTPFSGHASFPSGHATVAFATASALTRETSSRWVPCVAYPVAAMVGWSRVHDREHWTSDVVAGAALGTLSANWIDRRLLGSPGAHRVAFALAPDRHGLDAALGFRF